MGVYAAAYRLVESTQFLAWAISAAMLPWLARAQRLPPGRRLVRGYVLGLKAMNAILLPIGLVFVLFAEPLVDLLYGAAFRDAVLPLQLLGLTSALYGIQNFAGTTFIARDAAGTFARVVGGGRRAQPRRQPVRHPPLRRRRRRATALASGHGPRGREPRPRAPPHRPRPLRPRLPRARGRRAGDDRLRVGRRATRSRSRCRWRAWRTRSRSPRSSYGVARGRARLPRTCCRRESATGRRPPRQSTESTPGAVEGRTPTT